MSFSPQLSDSTPKWVCSVSRPKVRQEGWRKFGVPEVYLSFTDSANSEQALSTKLQDRGSKVQEGGRECSGLSIST